MRISIISEPKKLFLVLFLWISQGWDCYIAWDCSLLYGKIDAGKTVKSVDGIKAVVQNIEVKLISTSMRTNKKKPLYLRGKKDFFLLVDECYL